MTKLLTLLLIFTMVFKSDCLLAQKTNQITSGCKNGALIAIGGGRLNDDIMNEFRKLAGGDSAKIVVIPTANVLNNKIDSAGIKARFIKHGITNITILHTSDPKEAN